MNQGSYRFIAVLFLLAALLACAAVLIGYLRHGTFETTAFMGGLFMLFFAIMTGRRGEGAGPG